MKNLTYLLVAIAVGALIYFNLPADDATPAEPAATEEAKVCANTGEPCLEDHSCCAATEDHHHDHSHDSTTAEPNDEANDEASDESQDDAGDGQ